MADEQRVPSLDHLSIENSSRFNSKQSCPIDSGLSSVARNARWTVRSLHEWKRSLALAQLALDCEKLRRNHQATCPRCGGEA